MVKVPRNLRHTEIAERWEFIETSQYRVHGEKQKKKTQNQLGIKKSKRERTKDLDQKTITHKRSKCAF